MVDGGVDRILHRLIRFLHGLDVVLLADDQNLADEAVLLHLQDAADVDHIIEKVVHDPAEFLVNQLSDIWRHFEIATDDSGSHRETLA